jgi:hypothetical protein
LTEIARVLNSPQGGGVVSDSARTEVNALLRGDYTYKQIVQAAGILTQDMTNRQKSYQEQIGDIQKRLGSAAGAPTPGAAPAAGGNFWQQFGGVPR